MPKKPNPITYSIVVPAYKEEVVIGGSLKKLLVFLKQHGSHSVTEVIVVAADSGDKTAQIARKYADRFAYFQLIEPGPKVGKGRDVQSGMLAARGTYVLFTDADLATPAHHIANAWERLADHNTVVIGVRNLRTIHHDYRIIVSLCANLLTRLAVLPSIPDTQCGFKAFTRAAAQDIFKAQKIMGWGFDIEVLAIAKRHGYKIDKIRIDDWHDPKIDQGLVGESGLKAVVNTLIELYKIRRNLFGGQYDRPTKTKALQPRGRSK